VRAAREVFEGKRPGESLGWLRIGLDAVAGLSADTKKGILAERERRGCFHCLQEFMERTGITLEPCRMLIKAGAMDDLAGISCEASFPEKLAARQELFLQAECTAHVQKWAGSDSFLPYDAPAGSAARVDAAKALRTLCEQEREALGFTVTAHPLDLVIVPPNVIPAKEIRNHDGKRVHMAGWQISAKLLATRNDGRTMKILTLEDRTDTFEASLFPNVYTRLAPRTLGKGPYLVEGIVDMSLGSPMLTVKDIKVL